MVHECISNGRMDPSDINNVMSTFKAKAGNPPQESSSKINTHQRDVFARQINLPTTWGQWRLAGADMTVLQNTERKINIVGIDDHELTGLDVVTAAALFDTQKGPVTGIFHESAHLGKGDLFMLLHRWNGLLARWMTDPKLWAVPKELKPLMDMCSHSPLILVYFICIPSGFLLMMTFNNTLMSSSHHLTFGMLLFWIMVLHLHSLMKSTKKLMIHCFRTLFDEFGDLQQQVVQHLDVFWDSSLEETGSILLMLIFMRAILLNKTGNH